MKRLQNSGQDHDCSPSAAMTLSAVNKWFGRMQFFVKVDQVEDQVVVAFGLLGFRDDLSSSYIAVVTGTGHGHVGPPFEVQKSD